MTRHRAETIAEDLQELIFSGQLPGGDADGCNRKNERVRKIIYRQSKNAFLDQQNQRPHRRLTPFRRIQFRLRGRPG